MDRSRLFDVHPRARRTTRWSPRSGWAGGSAARRSSRRTSRSPTSGSTSSARPGACWPRRGARGCRPQRGRPGLPPRRARLPQRQARRARPDRLRRRDGAAAAVLDLPARSCTPRCASSTDPTLAGVAAQGGQGGRLPPRPRPPVGAPARRRHRRVPRADAGGARRRVAVPRRAVRAGRPTSLAGRRRGRPRLAPRRRPGRPRRWSARPHSTSPTYRPRSAVAATGLHTEQLGFLLAEMQHLHRSHPGATW